MERARALGRLVIVADKPSTARMGAAYVAGLFSGLISGLISGAMGAVLFFL